MDPTNRQSKIGNRRSSTPNFIRGIFNYCDRWCERCAFTERCRCYVILEERGLHDPNRYNLNQPESWEQLRQSFQATKEGILRTAAEQGIDLNDPDVSEETLKHEREVDELVDRHLPLLLRAQAYALSAARQLDDSSHDFQSGQDQQPSWVENLPPESGSEVREALEVIAYCHAFIYMKLQRAVYSWAEEQLEPAWIKELSKDSEGSAKVALIAIDRSWLARGTLRCHFAESEETTLEALRQLSDLREATERAFPAARGFCRPGFDEH